MRNSNFKVCSSFQKLLKSRFDRIAEDNRRFINGVLWILRTGSPWRDLPPDYGNWNNVNRRFCRWRDKGVWEGLFERLINELDYQWLMIDVSHIKAHSHAAGAKGGNKDMAQTKRGLNSKMHLAVDTHGLPIRIVVTAGDCRLRAGRIVCDG